MLYQDLPVLADVYALTQKIFTVTQDFPREYKFALGQDMKRDGLVLLRSIYRINKARDKVAHLEAFLDDFELLKLEIRLSADLKLLFVRKRTFVASQLGSSFELAAWADDLNSAEGLRWRAAKTVVSGDQRRGQLLSQDDVDSVRNGDVGAKRHAAGRSVLTWARLARNAISSVNASRALFAVIALLSCILRKTPATSM